MSDQNTRPFRKSAKPRGPKPEPKLLHQKYFKSVGPRTYAAQIKQAANGNHFLVLTEGKRDEKTNELRMSRLFVYSEDFADFFKLMHDAAVFVRNNPVLEKVKAQRAKIWSKKQNGAAQGATPVAAETAVAAAAD